MSATNDNRPIYKNSYIWQYRCIVRLTQDDYKWCQEEEYKWCHEEERGMKEDGE